LAEEPVENLQEIFFKKLCWGFFWGSLGIGKNELDEKMSKCIIVYHQPIETQYLVF